MSEVQNPDYRQQLARVAQSIEHTHPAEAALLRNPDLIVTTVPLLAAAIVSLIGDHPQGRAGALRVTRAIAAALKEANHD